MSLRNPFFAVPLAFVSGAISAVLGIGCLGGSSSASRPDYAIPLPTAYSPDASEAGDDAGPLAMTGVAAYQGSPLCNASPATNCCYPDSTHVCLPTPCEAPSDAGVPDGPGGFASEVIFGCHVAPAPPGNAAAAAPNVPAVAPACVPAGLGRDGAPCAAGGDCAPGYECVGSAPTATCRPYCCAGNIACLPDQFCDIQHTAQAAPINVPVCMPVEPCDLLANTGCNPGQTCAVVRENGSSSCVATGTAVASASCETEHCAAGLVCLGAPAPGARTCYKLCDMKAVPSKCAAPQTCKGGLPLFLEPGAGVYE
jgi:hypothetical protein